MTVEAGQARRFDLVLVDVKMPVTDSFQDTRAIRALYQARLRRFQSWR